jgi:RND family efflux transporter MFP subunit
MVKRERLLAGNPSESGNRRPLAGWALLGALLLILGCGQGNVYAPPPPPQVTVEHPVRRMVADYLEYTGNTQAINTVQLQARVQGFLEKVFFKDGDLVKKGQLLFLIQQNTYQAQLEQAEAQILQQKANYEHAVIETARYTKLVKQRAAAQTDLDNWRFQRDAYKAAMLAAQAARDLAKLNLSYTRVVAPFNGRIDRRLKDPGNLVGAGEFTPLAEINQIDPIYVYFTISELDFLRLMAASQDLLAMVNAGKFPVAIGLADEAGYPCEGSLDFAAITLDPNTGTLLLRGIFPNPDNKLIPGLFARVRIPLSQKRPSILVPQVALGYDQQGPYVLIVNDKNVVERRPVKTGSPVDNLRVVEEGLSGDEWVITTNLIRAIPGRPVKPERQEPGASGPAPPASPKP